MGENTHRSRSSDVEVIVLSSFLLLTWSSLRFADSQRCNIEGLCYTDQVLRGICWQTKTVSNVAWGLIGQGFLSHGSFNWLHKFLRTLGRIYHEHGQDVSIDFLFPSCTDESIRLPIQAMQYAECLFLFGSICDCFGIGPAQTTLRFQRNPTLCMDLSPLCCRMLLSFNCQKIRGESKGNIVQFMHQHGCIQGTMYLQL